MTPEDALKKVKKCFALSRSTNANEAAIALRQAQRLMAEHNLSEKDVALSDVSTTVCSARTNSAPPWEVRLAQLIADALEHIRRQPARCKPITLTARGDEFAWGWVSAAGKKLEAFANARA